MLVPATAKKVISAAESMGFVVQTDPVTLTKEEVVWASTKDGHNAGDIRTPAKSVEGVRIVGYREDSRLGFEVFFAPGFERAYVLDPIGRFLELKFDYSYTPSAAKDYGYTYPHAQMLAERRDREYNDGATLRQYDWNILLATPFYNWVDEWLTTFQSDHKKLTPVRKPKADEITPEDREAELLSGGDWVG